MKSDLIKYNLILFDADGTLFDYDMSEGMALKKVFEHNGFEYCENVRNRYRDINKNLWNEFEKGRIDKASLQVRRFQCLLEEFDFIADATAFNSLYLDFLSEGGHLINGALEVCKELSKVCTLAIATNGIAKTQRSRLKNSLIQPYIKYIIVSEEAGYQKPQNGFFQYAFNLCEHHSKHDVIIIGDSLSTDIKGGIDFGISTCWYNPTATKQSSSNVDYEIKDLRELLRII